MTVSQKQLEANRANARKGGVKTPEGKEIVRYNALKHGLLAREAVITVGEGAENPDEFAALLEDLSMQLQPQGVMEGMLVEKMAVAYWRLRRANRYEVGLIRDELDTASEDYYGKTHFDGTKMHKTDEEIEKEILTEKEAIASWKKDKRDFTRMRKKGKPFEEIYDWEGNWDWLYDKISHLFPEDYDYGEDFGAKEIREFLNTDAGWDDDKIWQTHIDICDDGVPLHREKIAGLEKEKEKNQLRLQVIKCLGSIPSIHELNRLLRYEGAIERQFYKALNQLERLQRMRAGDNVPPPLEVDVEVSAGEST
jgi:hypothetical protein